MSTGVDVAEVISTCPRLAPHDFEVTSPKDKNYNCVAWAVMRDKKWWWEPRNEPGCCWPRGAPFNINHTSFIKMFGLFGYIECGNNSDLEHDVEKIAVFKDVYSYFSHVSHQREDGKWTSKLGQYQDISHMKNEGVETFDYGAVVVIMKRKREIWGDAQPNLPEGVTLDFF